MGENVPRLFNLRGRPRRKFILGPFFQGEDLFEGKVDLIKIPLTHRLHL